MSRSDAKGQRPDTIVAWFLLPGPTARSLDTIRFALPDQKHDPRIPGDLPAVPEPLCRLGSHHEWRPIAAKNVPNPVAGSHRDAVAALHGGFPLDWVAGGSSSAGNPMRWCHFGRQPRVC